MASIKKYATKNGHMWRVQYRSPDGRNRTKQGFPTKAKAQTWADKNAVSIADHDWTDPQLKKQTLTHIAQPWLARIHTLSPSTRRVYTIAWNNHVEPYWGHQPIGGIVPSMVQQWVDTQSGGAVTIRRNVNVLAQILDYAVRDGALKSNPARGVMLPKKSKGVQVYLTAEQLTMLADEAGDNAVIVLLLGTVGLRWGELAGLKVGDIHFLARRIHVQRNAVTVGNDVIVGSVKTGQDRWVSVPGFILDMLAPLCRSKLPGAWVWERAQVGGPLKLPSRKSWFDGAVNRVMARDPQFPRVTVHGLRHVAAGLMISQGANVLAVSRQLGHADPSETLNRYAALFDSDLDRVGASMNEVFSSASWICRGIGG
ncbi:tyrosine-type recombinase/integrase [Corynebacterium macclintockiae]|uniref:tyrosine-type recombinase/integrase n=1 Tax=Corynebacterium macclintockiae TaxID=2913501 RepID=UPI003EB9A921